ncbi:MAG: DUF2304 domain-containing protein [Bryobacteraceae bacterium]|jgi:hypothetical protein|nr:DUF2304 domain-containing protein [Bryobacteraceae bacterium]
MQLLLNLLTGFGIFLFLVVLRSLRREHIRVEHSVSWLAASVALIAISLLVPLIDPGARTAGMSRASELSDALLFIVFAIALWIGYRSSRVASELKDMNITLTQRVAILEFQIRQLHEKEQARS